VPNYKSFSSCIHLRKAHKDQNDMRCNVVTQRYKLYNKTLHPLFATESVQKKIGMGTQAFFHSSSKFYQRHKLCEKTGRFRIEESNYFYSVKEEKRFLGNDNERDFSQLEQLIN